MRNIICILVLLFPSIACGQNIEVKRVDLKQGLSNNFIKGITQDTRGFLWFATEEGLSKLEGNRFKVFLRDEVHPEKGINANELNCVYADKDEPLIWIGTQREGLCSYNYLTNEFTSYRNNPDDPNSLITNDITSIIPASDGNLWLSTYHRGVEYLDKKTGRFTHYNSSTVEGMPNNVWTIFNATNGDLYIGHCRQGFTILSIRTKQFRNFRHKEGDKYSLAGNEVTSVFKDTNENIWIGSDKGLSLYNPETESFINFRDIPGAPASLGNNYIYGICQQGDNLWLGTEDDGAYYFNFRQRSFMSSEPLKFNHVSAGDENCQLSSSNITYIYPDSYNNIWFGTCGVGLNFISHDQPLFNVWAYTSNQQLNSSLSARTVFGLCADSSGKIWVGTEGGGVNLFEDNRRIQLFTKKSANFQIDRVLAVFEDSQKDIWLGFHKGPLYYKDDKNHFRSFSLGGDNDFNIRALYEDVDQHLWVGTNLGAYVVNLKNKNEIHHYDTVNSLIPENFVRCFVQDKEHRIWIGTFGRGIGVYSENMEEVVSLNTVNGFCSNRIEHLFKDSQNRIWVATSAGVVLFENTLNLSNYRQFGRKNGLRNSHIQAIIEDKIGNIWLSTNSGISMISRDLKQIDNYDYTDGTPMAEFTPGAVTQDIRGNIYFGSNNGVCYFNPAYVMQKYSSPLVVFTELKVENDLFNDSHNGGISLLEEKAIAISYQQNAFSISFNVQDYSLNGRVEYAYRLKGMNDTWYPLGDETKVTFRNLPHGDYQLQVRARLHNQEWESEFSSLNFTVYPPFWNSWWAKIFYVLLLAGIAVYQFRSYKRKMEWESNYEIEKQNRIREQQIHDERLRFFTNITHELRTPLTLILGPLEDMKKDTTLSNIHVRKVSVIYQSAVRLLKLINQLLEFRKTETQNKKLVISRANLSTFVNEIALKYQELNQNPAVNIQVDIKEKNLFLYFDKEVVTMIVDNLISNAIKYTSEGTITITLRQETDDLTAICILDTGYGIAEEAIPHIFERYYQEGIENQASGTGVGLSLVKNLVELHGGDIRVESMKGKGSCFIFMLSTHNTYPGVPHAQEEAEMQSLITEDSDTLEAEEPGDSHKQILLIVEDNVDIRTYIASFFSEEFEVVTAENGKEGIEKAFQYIPDVVISDIMMPKTSGVELCRTLKADVRTSHIPVILLTAKDSLEDKEEGYEIGADSYITKPFSASLLRSRIHNLLELRSKLASRIGTIGWEDKRDQVMNSLNQIDNEFIEKTTLLIEENLSSDKVDINYLAEHLCMSVSTLYRKIKALTNLSTNEFIRKVKMKNAERLLLEQKYSISEISYKMGFNTVSYFRQCFIREFGMNPTQYMKKIKGITIKDEKE